MAGLSNGRITFLNVWELEAFNVEDASSKWGSNWFIAAIPALTPTGIFLNTKAITKIIPVPVSSSGGTLNASSSQTFRNVILPLLKPAITASLVFSFVRAMTAISAVIFLVSANYDLAVSYILGRLENNDYGLAIVYSSALIVVMLFTITLMQLIIGKRKLGRRDQTAGMLQGNLG